MSRVLVSAALYWLAAVVPASAQVVLTLQETIARAHEQAGVAVIARARIVEAEASVIDASARLRDNPLIEGAAGPRTGPSRRGADVELAVSQQFETGGQRQSRIAGARAAVDRQRAEGQQSVRLVVFDAALAFLDAVAATERLRITEGAEAIARELLNATERRFALGDIAAIDVNLARIDAARSTATLVSGRAGLTAAIGTLRAILRIPATEPIELRGSLDLPPPPPLERLEALVEGRPEFAVLKAETREADAQAQLGRALGRPDLGFRVAYAREQSDTIVLGGLTITLPAFQKGQGTLAAGVAKANRARTEAEISRQAAVADVRTAYAVYERQAMLSAALEKDAAPSLADNETLARRSYEAGEMNLMDSLLIRRDAIDMRLTIIDRRLDAARSRLRVDFAAGVIQ
jgi:cobalt-zinc-cadmium efflux system outer membrane protein